MTALTHTISGMSTTFYPVLTLPPEITSQFFLHCIPVPSPPYAEPAFAWIRINWEYSQQRPPQAAPPPGLILSQVCHSWRDIVLDTPALWVAFPLKASSLRSRPPSINSWLIRARDCPLTFTWHATEADRHFKRASRYLKRILYSFRENTHRMGVVDLSIQMNELKKMACSGAPWHFPALHTLSLYINDSRYASSQGTPVRVSAPLLRDLSMYGWNLGVDVVLETSWTQLTTLTLELYSITSCLSILSLALNLLECRLSVFSARGRWHSSPTPLPIPGIRVALLRLHTLTLFGSWDRGPEGEEACRADILDYLTLPALHTIKIFDLDPETDPCFLGAFLARCNPPLRSLVLHKRGGTAIDMGAFVLMPNLARLEIWRPSAAFMAVLSEDVFAPGSIRSALPQLQRLTLIGRFGSHERKVWEGHMQEHKSWADRWGEHDLERVFLPFKALAAEGVEVCIEGSGSYVLSPPKIGAYHFV